MLSIDHCNLRVAINAALLALVVMPMWATKSFGDNEDMRHPIYCYNKYKKCRHCSYDSILVGRITYDPLPEYQTESRMLIEYYCSFDSDKDVVLRADGETYGYQASEYMHIWPGPVKAGDTLRAELTIIPLKVGGVRPSFGVLEQSVYDFPDSTVELEIMRAAIRGHFMLDHRGKVVGMNSEATNDTYATFLGPSPEVMADSLLFFWDPKLPPELRRDIDEKSYQYRYFAIEEVVFTRPDDSGYYHVKCLVSPYHNFDGGIKFNIGTGGGVQYKNKSPDYNGPVSPKDVLEFHFDFRITEPGISRISASFRTLNPETGMAPFEGEIGHGYEKLANWIGIYVGYDSAMNPVFITDHEPFHQLKGNSSASDILVQQRLAIQRRLDPRIEWLEKAAAISPLRPGHK